MNPPCATPPKGVPQCSTTAQPRSIVGGSTTLCETDVSQSPQPLPDFDPSRPWNLKPGRKHMYEATYSKPYHILTFIKNA
eukprot:3721225-Amphidinium_carterae.1